ncbi:MAG: phage terminase small subunit P27 family [Candidatus Eisenbacteria sp.]|nr:phage terminase small subunit P27 family [Candidatus Eisenbacteria bacterium]
MGRRGPAPKPKNLKELTGSAKHDPQRVNHDEPQPPIRDDVPRPPDSLDAVAAREWLRIAPILHRLGLLTEVDLVALEAYCVVYGRWVYAEEQIRKFGMVVKSPKNETPMQSPYLSIANKALLLMRSFVAEFGMTPSSRTNVSGTRSWDPAKADDHWGDLDG